MTLSIAANGGACCECPQLTGCDCNGIACALTCESKAGTATLCGFEEFVASLPPKLYRRKETSGLMYFGRWDESDDDCPSDAGSLGPETFETAFTRLSQNLSFTATLEPTGNPNEYIIHVTKDGDAEHGQLWTRWFSGIGTYGQGVASFSTPPSLALGPDETGLMYFDMGLQNFDGSAWAFGTPTSHRFYIGARPEISTRDLWDQFVQYGSADCEQGDGDASTRHEKVNGEFPLDSGGTPASWTGFDAAPDIAYAGLVEAGVLNATKKETIGTAECTLDGDGKYYQVQGTVTEELSDEDTDGEAEARAADALPAWSSCPTGCPNCSAFRSSRGAGVFEFAWRKQRVKVSWAAVVDPTPHTYKVTVRFVRRLLGSSGPGVFYALEERTIVADNVSEETDWIDVPNEAGWETWPANCSVEDIT